MFIRNLKYSLLLLLILQLQGIKAQVTPMEQCGYQYEVEKIIKRQPNFITWQNEWYKQAQEQYLELQSQKRRIVADTEFYEIPVVIHVIYNNTAQNISTALIMSQLNELNLDFRKLNEDTSRIRNIFKPLAADVRIQFKLALKDPNGNPTTGINRISTTVTTFAINQDGRYTENMKSSANGGQDAWNPAKYLNLWICNMEFPNPSSIVYGFATPPTGSPNWDQFPGSTRDTSDATTGVVLHYKIVGKNNPLAPVNYKEGNTATHEIGHYLGMRHIWGDASLASQGCTVDDGIFDTPNAKDKNFTCNNPTRNTCTDAVNDKPDMTENYMDYALDGCAGMFTKEQAHLMRYVLNNFRTGLPSRKITSKEFPFVSVYPNPSGGQKNINILISVDDPTLKYKVSLINYTGQRLFEMDLKANTADYFNVESYSPSFYYLIISDDSGKVLEKKTVLIMP